MAITITALEERVNNHINFFWKVVAGLVGAVVLVGGGWLGGLTYYLIQTKESVDRLPLRISETLVDKAKGYATSGLTPKAATALQAATALVSTAQDEHLQADPRYFERQVKALSALSQPTMLPAANELRFALASYRSRLNPVPPTPQKEDKRNPWVAEYENPANLKSGNYQITATIHLTKNAKLSGPPQSRVVVDATSLRRPLDIISPPSRSLEDNHTTVDGLIFWGGTQTLDGIDWENVTFVNTHIAYQSGSMKLRNVRFINCTFDLPNNQDGARIADYAALNTTAEFRIG